MESKIEYKVGDALIVIGVGGGCGWAEDGDSGWQLVVIDGADGYGLNGDCGLWVVGCE